jgi:hypothetical protein
LLALGDGADSEGGLDLPLNVAVDNQRYVEVSNTLNNRTRKFRQEVLQNDEEGRGCR